MNVELLPKEIILNIFHFLDWRDLKSVSEVSPLFQRLAEVPYLHRNDFLTVDVTEAQNTKSYGYLRYLFKARNIISKVQITDVTSLTKKNPSEKSLDITRLMGFFSPIADNIVDLDIKATVSESCLGVLQIFQNLKKLRIHNFYPVYDEFYEKNKKPCLGYSDYCRMRDTWTLEGLKCLKLEGKSWTLMGSLLRKTNKGLFRSLCCYHTDKRDLRLKDRDTGDVRGMCGDCDQCPEE